MHRFCLACLGARLRKHSLRRIGPGIFANELDNLFLDSSELYRRKSHPSGVGELTEQPVAEGISAMIDHDLELGVPGDGVLDVTRHLVVAVALAGVGRRFTVVGPVLTRETDRPVEPPCRCRVGRRLGGSKIEPGLRHRDVLGVPSIMHRQFPVVAPASRSRPRRAPSSPTRKQRRGFVDARRCGVRVS